VLRRSEVGSTYLTNDGLVLAVRGEIRCLMGTHRHGPTARAQSAARRGGGGGKRQVLQLLQFHVRGVQDRLRKDAKQSLCADSLELLCFLFVITSQTSGARTSNHNGHPDRNYEL
jgi:hypothetical protein